MFRWWPGKKGFGAIYCQPRQTAVCVEPSVVDFREFGWSQIMGTGDQGIRGSVSVQRVKIAIGGQKVSLLWWNTKHFPSSCFWSVVTCGKRTVENMAVQGKVYPRNE